MQPLPLLTTAAQIDELIKILSGVEVIAFDTEFHSERTYIPRLMLLQLATRDAVYLVDPLGQGDMRALCKALARPGLSVVGHALKNDLRILQMQFGQVPVHVFDTQLAAAFLGHGLQVGLGSLLQNVLGVHQPKGDQMSDWSQRPLPDRMLGYAAGDVAHLLLLYDRLQAELTRLGRLDWVREECHELTDPTRYNRDPELAWQKVAGGRRMDPREGGVLAAVAAEREMIAAEEDIVPHFLLPDEVVLLLARHAPRQRKDLDADRRFNHRAIHRHGTRWLDAIGRGLDMPLKRAPSRPPPAPELEAVAALLMLLVQDIAQREGLATPLLIKRDALLNAVRETPSTVGAFAAAAELSGWRGELLAGPLWSLLTGTMKVSCEIAGDAMRLRFG